MFSTAAPVDRGDDEDPGAERFDRPPGLDGWVLATGLAVLALTWNLVPRHLEAAAAPPALMAERAASAPSTVPPSCRAAASAPPARDGAAP